MEPDHLGGLTLVEVAAHGISDLGVQLGTDGKITFDTAVFTALSDNRISSAFDFFGSASLGFGALAKKWLREKGLGEAGASVLVERAKEALASPPRRGRPDAATVRLEVLDGASGRRRLSAGETRERETLRRREGDAVREGLRGRRRTWAHDSQTAANGPDRTAAERAAASGRGSRTSR